MEYLKSFTTCVSGTYYNACSNISNGFYIDGYGVAHDDSTLPYIDKNCDDCPESETCCYFQYYWDGNIMGEVMIGGWGC